MRVMGQSLAGPRELQESEPKGMLESVEEIQTQASPMTVVEQ